MILKELLEHFDIDVDLPDYLLNQRFNEVFLDGDLTIKDNAFHIAVTTRQDVTHQMFIRPDDEFPLIILSELPSGLLNGMKFGRNEGEEIPINKL
jgi:hypothetical protein